MGKFCGMCGYKTEEDCEVCPKCKVHFPKVEEPIASFETPSKEASAIAPKRNRRLLIAAIAITVTILIIMSVFFIPRDTKTKNDNKYKNISCMFFCKILEFSDLSAATFKLDENMLYFRMKQKGAGEYVLGVIYDIDDKEACGICFNSEKKKIYTDDMYDFIDIEKINAII